MEWEKREQSRMSRDKKSSGAPGFERNSLSVILHSCSRCPCVGTDYWASSTGYKVHWEKQRPPCFTFQLSSVAQSCPTLCDPMDHSTPGLPVHHQLPEFTQPMSMSRWCHPAISSSVVPFSSCPQSFPASFYIITEHRAFTCEYSIYVHLNTCISDTVITGT